MIKQETSGSYLVERLSPDLSQEEEFSLRMLSENKIPGLLSLKVRTLNAESSLYYEITGLQSLEAFCRIRPLSGRLLRRLLADLMGLCEKLGEYVLKEDRIALSFDRIFTDASGFYFCYVFPKEKGDDGEEERQSTDAVKEARSAFAGELLSVLDHEDEEAVLYGYRFYKAAGETRELLGCLEKTLGEESIQESIQEGLQTRSKRDDRSGESEGKQDSEPLEGDGQKEKEGFQKQSRFGGRDIPGAVLFLLLSVIGVVLLVLRSLQIRPFAVTLLLSQREGIAGGLFFLVGAAGMVVSLRKKTPLQ